MTNDISAFQPANDNPNILNITSSHLIGDLFNKYLSRSFEKSILEEHSILDEYSIWLESSILDRHSIWFYLQYLMKIQYFDVEFKSTHTHTHW